MDKSMVVAAAEMAVMSDVNNMTCDRIEALTAGHGMVNMSVYAITNVIATELLNGGDLSMKFANSRHLPYEDIMRKAIDAAKAAGSDAANAAFLTACIMYLCGTSAQCGIPAGNRKLGATARMIAGVDRCGVAAVPTTKLNNKISGFPAVMAIYQAMMNGELCTVKGTDVPLFVSGSPVFGHSALGEDIVWPQMATNGARIGTQAMMDAMSGAAVLPHPFTCAVLGAAAILEIIHPDAEVPEGEGTYGKTTSAYLVGRSAAETAGLPKTLHVKATNEEFETAKIVGDIGLLIKDIGGVSVIGMMAFTEIFSIFQEGIAGFSGLPLNPPLGHIACYAVIALMDLLATNGDTDAVAKKIADECYRTKFDGETALISINTVTQKSLELCSGPVTTTLIAATEPMKMRAIYRRAEKSYEMLSAGKTLVEVCKQLDDERLAAIEAGADRIFSGMLGKEFHIKVKKVANGSRRTVKLAKKYLALDADIDIEATCDGTTFDYSAFCQDKAPRISQGEFPELAGYAPFVSAICNEIMLASHTIINATVPAAVATAMGLCAPEDAVKLTSEGCYFSIGVPGNKAGAVAKKAAACMACINAE